MIEVFGQLIQIYLLMEMNSGPMMTKSMKAVTSLLNNPLHAIVGLDLLVKGLILLTHKSYFSSRLGLIYWAVSSNKSIKLNQVLISTASVYFTLLAVTEFLHGFFAPLGTPHMYTGARRFRNHLSIILIR